MPQDIAHHHAANIYCGQLVIIGLWSGVYLCLSPAYKQKTTNEQYNTLLCNHIPLIGVNLHECAGIWSHSSH